MLKATKTINISGQSVIENSIVATMSATIAIGGNFNSSRSVLKPEIYYSNKEAVQLDFQEFDKMADNLAGGGENE